jgi:hypothetical protein
LNSPPFHSGEFSIDSYSSNAQRFIKFVSNNVPNGEHSYKFTHEQEREYNEEYRNSWFAHTQKKGGWDCLRHYEIMANGCIPFFPNLENCPKNTLTHFPKELILETNKLFEKFNGLTERSVGKDQISASCEEKFTTEEIDMLDKYSTLVLNYTREHCSTSAAAKYFLNVLASQKQTILDQCYLYSKVSLQVNLMETNILSHKKIKNILLVRCNIGVNYTRELLWIGLKNLKGVTESKQGLENECVLVEYPKIDYLYDSFPEEQKKNLYGNGFTYSRKIKETDSAGLNDYEIIEKTKNGFWDLVIFGKIGPDEGWEGSIPHIPLWDQVYKRYKRDQIVFLYGGDECINMHYENKYKQHIEQHCNYGHCFVRELDG